MASAEIVAREKRQALPAAAAAFGAVVAFIVAVAASQGLASGSSIEYLREFDANQSTLLLGAVLQALSTLLLIPPLAYLFRAAAARSDAVRDGLVGITIAGPLFVAIGIILQWIAVDQAAAELLASGVPGGEDANEFADELIQDQSIFGAAQGFSFAGTIGLVAAVVYTSLHAMRTGLLTRFWGTLGMALGVSYFFLRGPIGVLVFMIALGLIYLDRWPGGRPEAWDAGVAMPWPKPGDPPPDEPAKAETDLDEPNPVIDGTAAPAPPPAPLAPPPPPRKRKSRDPE